MATNGERLAAAAKSAPDGIMICHNSVLYWIKQAGLISQARFDRIQQTTPAGGWDQVLCNGNDTQVQNYPNGLSALSPGTIIGFIDPMMLQHSMVVIGHENGRTGVTGVNNLNVLDISIAEKVGTNYALVTDNQLKPLTQGMQVHWVDVTTVLARLPPSKCF